MRAVPVDESFGVAHEKIRQLELWRFCVLNLHDLEMVR